MVRSLGCRRVTVRVRDSVMRRGCLDCADEPVLPVERELEVIWPQIQRKNITVQCHTNINLTAFNEQTPSNIIVIQDESSQMKTSCQGSYSTFKAHLLHLNAVMIIIQTHNIFHQKKRRNNPSLFYKHQKEKKLLTDFVLVLEILFSKFEKCLKCDYFLQIQQTQTDNNRTMNSTKSLVLS